MGLANVVVTLFMVLSAGVVRAGWAGPQEMALLDWGSGATEVGVRVGDTLAYDRVASIDSVSDQYVFVADEVNERYLVVDFSGAVVAINDLRKCSMIVPRSGPRKSDSRLS